MVSGGDRFGEWTVLVFEGHDKGGNRLWRCRCSCGNESVVQDGSLRHGRSVRCKDCFNASRRGQPTGRTGPASPTYKDGRWSQPEYHVWQSMKQRCLNQSNHAYPDYGGRGITICDRWLSEAGYANFIADMGRRPSNRHSIDRVNNDAGYSPENCRWATRSEQNQNLRTNVVLAIGGESHPVGEWARREGVPKSTIFNRLQRGCNATDAVHGRNSVSG